MLDQAPHDLIGHGDTANADMQLCKYVGERLMRDYPGHVWLVRANAVSGTVTIDLPYSKPINLAKYGWLLHMRNMDGPGADRKIRHAGGELLERFGLPRGPATMETRLRAAANGFDITGALK